ncbi:MAG: VanZ family protein [Coprobacillus sp.]
MRKLRYVFLLIMILSFSIQFIYILSNQLTFSIFQKLILAMIEFISIIGYTYFYTLGKDEKEKKRIFHKSRMILFVIYSLNLIYVLFLDPGFGRHILTNFSSLKEYISYNVNLIPFETIHLFIDGYKNDVVTLETLLRNLFGNLVVFMPMAYLLPALFKKQKKFLWFFVTIVLIVFFVEVMQVVLMSGSGDIDDFILNVSGCLLIYVLLKCFHRGEVV